MPTVASALARGAQGLGASSESARSDAALLLEHVLGRPRAWIVAHGEATLSDEQTQAYAQLCDARRSGKPLAYILGVAGFYGREFIVDERVLVPRPETEHLVDEALDFLSLAAQCSERVTVLDAGIGSGAIGCTIAAEVPRSLVDATDTSAGALAVARHNAARFGVAGRITFHLGTLPSPPRNGGYDVVVANLPYIPTADVPVRPDTAGFEPREALDGGPDGLDAYRSLLAAGPRLLKPGGLLLLEGAAPVMHGLARMAQAAFPGAGLAVEADYAGLDRYVKVKLLPEASKRPH